ncbi:MAG: hypothetical protein JSW58_12130 [Candidatus Latescibacterota bacterium]|nr:MAG: hypothetical protein JSW58_12130 [Candidatus Latescibacterota bacterium]
MDANAVLADRLRKPVLVVFACVLFITLTPAPGLAECPPPPTESPLAVGEVGLFFDTAGTMNCDEVVPFVITELYLVARAPEGGIASFSISELLIDPGPVLVLSTSVIVDNSYQVQVIIDACSEAVRVDPEVCPTTEGELLVLAVYQVMFYVSSGTVCFQTACPTIAGIWPMNPVYTRCDTGAWGELVGGESMCLGLGEAPVSVDASTWGKIKSIYAAD